MLAPHVRVSTGALVRKVDPQTIAQLEQELASQGRTRRLRALQVAQCLRAEREVEAQLIELLADEDPFVRIETAHLLAACDSTPARQALRGALLDRHAAVKEAAERSLRALSSANPTQRSRDTVAMPPRTVPLVPATDRSTS
jgi:HEAT repeat protein